MKFELKKIDLFSAVKVCFVIHVIIGLFVGLLVGTFFAFIFGTVGQLGSTGQFDNSGFNPMALGAFGGFLMGLLYAFAIVIMNGIILPTILVLLYNLAAGWLGGVKFDFKETIPDIKPTVTLAEQAGEQGGVTNG